MTILCGFSTNFATLLIARTGLALAEGIVPMAVVSIICDLAPARLVPRASALFMAAPFLGSGAALLLGGPALTILDAYKDIPIPLVGQFEPWRGLFWSLGLIGLGLGLGLPWLVREPVRRSTGIETDSTLSVLPFLHIHLKFVTILFASTSMFLVAAYTVYAWMPTYMIRMQGISPSQAGLSVGSIFIIAGIGGCVFGSWIMGRGTTGYEMSHVVRMMFRLQLGMWPPLIMLPFAPTPSIALTLLGIEFFLMAAGLSSAITPAALFAPPALRGRILAVAGLTNSVIGGLGPMAVGAINDFVLGTPDRIDLSLAVTFASACMVGISIGPLALRLAIDFDKRRILAAEPNAFRPQEL
jgi:predicted MFS family arabinose efflux permease